MKDHPIVHRLKTDLQTIHDDWILAAADSNKRRDPLFLEKFAKDVIVLNQDAQTAKHVNDCRKKARLVAHLLTTPWGAPFIADMTLLEAAETFVKHPKIPSSFPLMVENFARYESRFKSQIFDIFDDVSEEI